MVVIKPQMNNPLMPLLDLCHPFHHEWTNQNHITLMLLIIWLSLIWVYGEFLPHIPMKGTEWMEHVTRGVIMPKKSSS